jgi:DNA-binding MarR family transcriptional regulator
MDTTRVSRAGDPDLKQPNGNGEAELRSVDVMLSALEPFRGVNPTMPLQLAFTFLLVARNEGLPVTEYAKRAGMAPGVMARNLLDLGEYNRRREPGLELVEERVDPMDRRIHRKFLTHKGRRLVGAVTRAMERMKHVAGAVAWILPTVYCLWQALPEWSTS